MPYRRGKRVFFNFLIYLYKQVKHRTHKTDDNDDIKIPKSFVIKKGKIDGDAPELLSNFRIVMSPNTALRLKERK